MASVAGLKKEYKKTGNGRAKIRMLAVLMTVQAVRMTVKEAARHVRYSKDSVRRWRQRYDEDGIKGLFDRPRTGRPPKIDPEELEPFMHEQVALHDGRIKPDDMQQLIFGEFDVEYTVQHVRGLMHKMDMTPKKSQHVHVNRATEDELAAWQIQFRIGSSRRRGAGSRCSSDESVSVYDSVTGNKYWSYEGERINVGYTGNHERVIQIGAGDDKGEERMFRGCDEFHDTTALSFLRELRRQYGRVAVARAGAAARGQHNQGLR